MKQLFSFLFILFLLTQALSQNLKAEGSRIVDANGNEVVLRGMGLGGWMLQEPYMLQLSGAATAQYDIRNKIRELVGEEKTKKFYEAWLQNHCTKADIDSLAAWGFNSVRLPMHYNLFTLPVEEEPVKGKQTWLSKGFELTDSLLSWCSANRIYLILDLHASPGGQGNDNAISDRDSTKASLWQSEPNRRKTIALWQELAKRYAKEEWLGAYDLINEPNWGFQNMADKNGCAETGNAELLAFLKDITAAIRKADQQHIIIIEGNCWGNNYEGMFPLWDNNMVISFHKYWNYTDKNSIQKFIDYRSKYNVPVWMGESGENSNSWFTSAIRVFEENKIGWAWWPMKKSGINNPLEVKINPGYQEIINYWRGKAAKPSAVNAYDALMQFANDTRIANNIFHKDVIDAMFRQVHSTATLPFRPHLVKPDTKIFAVDYDLGKIGYAYHDADSGTYWVSTGKRTEWNRGRKYRNDGVDIDVCSDSITNGYYVGWTEDGEWMRYTVFAEKEGLYNINLRYSSETDAKVLLMINETPPVRFDLETTGNYTKWQTSVSTTIKLQHGANSVRLYIAKGGVNLNYLQFIFQNTTANIN